MIRQGMEGLRTGRAAALATRSRRKTRNQARARQRLKAGPRLYGPRVERRSANSRKSVQARNRRPERGHTVGPPQQLVRILSGRKIGTQESQGLTFRTWHADVRGPTANLPLRGMPLRGTILCVLVEPSRSVDAQAPPPCDLDKTRGPFLRR